MKKITICYIVFILTVMNIYSQKSNLNRADKEYDKFAYVDAIKTYERIFNKGYRSVEILENLGNAYYFKGELVDAAKWYGELYNFSPDLEPEYYYRYAQSLKAIKEYKKADDIMAKFHEVNSKDSRGKKAVAQKDYLAVIKKNSGRYTIKNSDINTEYSDYGSAFLNDNIVFCSSRGEKKVFEKINPWTGERYTNLYSAYNDRAGTLSNVQRISNDINSKYNESTPVFTKDQATVYFTRNNYLKKKGKDDTGTIRLKIYRATFKKGKWGDVTELPFNSDDYSVAHPALSPDEQYLYFSSNMPGTLGQSDIFRVIVNYDGTFGAPENMGPIVNTEGRETFPFVSAENELYFSSDGHPGLGGLDVFVYRVGENTWRKIVLNIGEPLNSPSDDFAFLIDTKTKWGCFTSNREGGKGGDDIYTFKELKEIQYPCDQLLSGKVTDKRSGVALAEAKVSLYDNNYNTIKVVISDNEGKFDFGLIECSTQYHIKSEKLDYTTVEVPFVTGDESAKTYLPLMLDKTIKELKLGDDLAVVLELKPIFFDLDKSNIRPDATLELIKILDVMEQNPNIKVDIRSHTDSRNSKEYNRSLSDRRAKATMAWLVKNGINKIRLTAKGYGESQLLNKCADGVNCTQEEHQKNRRSEFIIVK